MTLTMNKWRSMSQDDLERLTATKPRSRALSDYERDDRESKLQGETLRRVNKRERQSQ